MFHLTVNFCKFSETSVTEGSNDVDHVNTTTAVTARHHDDELVCDSLSETEHSPLTNERSFYSSTFLQHANTQAKSPFFTFTTKNGLNNDNHLLDGNSQIADSQGIFRNTLRNKMPLKAVDLDSTDVNHLLQANDRSVVRNITPGTVVGGYASREKTLRCDFNQLNALADHHINWILK